MRRYLVLLALAFIALNVSAQNQADINQLLLPVPVSAIQQNGQFEINSNIQIHLTSSDAAAMNAVDYLRIKIRTATGFATPVTNGETTISPDSRIDIILTNDTALGNEGYHLEVNSQKVTLQAQKPAGLFYGIQSLLQLMPAEIESQVVRNDVKWVIPACTITDTPRFAWRGLMLDVSRHFFTKEEVKQFIDEMVKYKFNVLHWHLTDDEGWRVEIKSYPNLTKKGAWGVKREGYFGNFPKPSKDDKYDYGGFYTQDDIREIVKYAKDRFVDIMPEVDVPGHSLATVVSYPELSCTADAVNYHVRSGEQIIDWSKGLPPHALLDNTLCPANEKVYTFLDNVFGELAELFPFEYIHIGGDECSKNFWEKSPEVRALMKREKLKNMEEVQSYFVKRVGKIVESKGKKFIGWDEILEGGLAPGAAVMSWRGTDGGIQAAKLGHEVVMSPTTFAYLDYMQGDPAIESRVYASLTLKKAYEFNPLPEGINPDLIKGGQGNLWTEQIYNNRYRQYMLWPRGMAIAEAVWSPMDKRNWTDFESRVERQLPRFDAANVKYAPSIFEPEISVVKDAKGALIISLDTEAPGVDIHYSFDNSFPDNFYPKYNSPVTPVEGSEQLKLVSYKNGKQVGRFITVQLKDLEQRVKK